MLHITWHEIKKFKIFLLIMLLLPYLARSSTSTNSDSLLGLVGMMLLWNIFTVGLFAIQVFSHDFSSKTIFLLLAQPLGRLNLFLGKFFALLSALLFLSFFQLLGVQLWVNGANLNTTFWQAYLILLVNGLFLISLIALINVFLRGHLSKWQIALVAS